MIHFFVLLLGYVLLFLLMDYNNDLWIGSLTDVFIRKCVDLSLQRCPGCQVKLKSPFLHQHHQHSLLDKMKLYFDEVRGVLLPLVEKLYELVEKKLPHSIDPDKDREIYCNNAVFFLTTANPDSIYWGRFLDENNDGLIYDLLPSKKRKCSDLTQMF